MNTQDTQNTERPLGYWLKAADRLMAAEFAAAFENEGITRREWRLLNAIDGSTPVDRRIPAHKLDRLVELGWIIRTPEGWSLTDEGTAAKERLGAIVDGIRLKVTDAVSPEDYETTIATLQQIATAYGWEEGIELPRGRRHGHPGFGRGHGSGRGHGFGPRHGFGHGHGHGFGHGRGHGFGHPFGPRHGFDPREGFDPRDGFGPREGFGPRHGFDPRDGHRGHGRFGDGGFPHDGFAHDERFAPEHGPRHGNHRHAEHGDHRHGEHRHGGPARAARAAQHAYERGFDAGFDRGSQAR